MLMIPAASTKDEKRLHDAVRMGKIEKAIAALDAGADPRSCRVDRVGEPPEVTYLLANVYQGFFEPHRETELWDPFLERLAACGHDFFPVPPPEAAQAISSTDSAFAECYAATVFLSAAPSCLREMKPQRLAELVKGMGFTIDKIGRFDYRPPFGGEAQDFWFEHLPALDRSRIASKGNRSISTRRKQGTPL